MQDIAHYAQLIRQPAPRFCRFNFGSKCAGPLGKPRPCNLAAYGLPEPPAYDLGAIRTPLALLSGVLAPLQQPVMLVWLHVRCRLSSSVASMHACTWTARAAV